MLWSQPKYVNMDIDETPFASGGFRNAHKASVADDGTIYVVKKYTNNTLESLDELKETPEAHARKSVQMHLLAKHFADQLKQSLKSKNYAGDVFAYNKVSFGTIVNTKEVITIEQFVDG